MGRCIAIETARARRALQDASAPSVNGRQGSHQRFAGQALGPCTGGDLAVIKRVAVERNQENARRGTRRDRTTKSQ